VITISSDGEDEDARSQAEPSLPDDEDELEKPQKRTSGKLRPVRKGTKTQAQQPTPLPTQNGSSQKSPAKAKAPKSKAKPAAQDPSKGNGQTIYSFFNAATQKQRTSQPSASPEKPIIPPDLHEAIEDDEDDDHASNVRVSKGSSTALAVRKRKGDGFESGPSQPHSQKFRKVSSGGDRVPSLAIVNDDKRSWTEQFAPLDLAELAVHKKKVADVRQWLDMAFHGRRQRVLVLKGAAGTGKTTTIRLLAQDMGVHIVEWRNPAEPGSDASTGAQFTDFVGRAGRSGGLVLSDQQPEDPNVERRDGADVMLSFRPSENSNDEKQTLLLVEEFPNTFSRTSSTLQSFRSTVMQYLSSPPLNNDAVPTPIVMIISETLLSTNTALADSFTAHRLLGPELANHPFLDIIEFNAVAPTYLSKALETIVVKEARKSGRRRTPGPQVLKHIAESGDIRSAVSSLEFLCLRGDKGDVWSSKVPFGKQKKSKAETPLTQFEVDALKLISNRESTLGIFHAVGKVVYNKRVAAPAIAHPPPWLPQHRRDKVPENDVDQMIDELGTDVSTFIAALHENYVLSCGSTASEESLDSLTGCINSISDADLLSVDRFSFGTRAFSGSATDSLRQDEMAFQAAVRGLLFNLPYPVHRSVATDGRKADAHKMFYPAALKLWKTREEIESVLDLLTARFLEGGLGGSSSQTKIEGATGVEAWKRNASSLEQEVDSATATINNSMKREMLLERLPYMAHIVGLRSPSLAEQISTVARIRSTAPSQLDDEADADEEEDGSTTEQWATDKPDAESVKPPLKKRKTALSTKNRSGHAMIPVESGIEKLVLEEDDIVDDL
jgi:cell cycle checkpoint protein